MRKLILQVQTSIDGYAADSDGAGDWMVWSWGDRWAWDDELRAYHAELAASIDSVLLSRKMAEGGFIGHWAEIAERPDDPQSGFARDISDAHKIVFSNTLTESHWDNTELVHGDLADEITVLKARPGENIIVYGGASFVASTIATGLIDEFHFLVNPAALGRGLPIFDKLEEPLLLSLAEARGFECGVVVLRYTARGSG